MIPFNKPFLTGKETEYITDAVASGKISGNGKYTKLCHEFFEEKYKFKKCLLTTSCTDALEMAALLVNIKQDDEVIMPSYTFVSTANAFILRGAKIVFADSMKSNPNIDADVFEKLVTQRTRAIVVVHYAGIACDMDKIMAVAKKYNLFVIEDAAQAIDSFYINNKGERKPLGSIGHLAAFSFHETKNIISGEGGMLVVNDDAFVQRAEIIWEKGTNRSAFFRGEIDKYNWVDIGSSFLPSEIVAAFLYAQLEHLEEIEVKRKNIWNTYCIYLNALANEGYFQIPLIPCYATNNGHMFFLKLNNSSDRSGLIEYLKEHNIHAVFHYLSLHKSPYYNNNHDGGELTNCDSFSETLLRLPMYYELSASEVQRISNCIKSFFGK